MSVSSVGGSVPSLPADPADKAREADPQKVESPPAGDATPDAGTMEPKTGGLTRADKKAAAAQNQLPPDHPDAVRGKAAQEAALQQQGAARQATAPPAAATSEKSGGPQPAKWIYSKGMDWLKGAHQLDRDIQLPAGATLGLHAFERVMSPDEANPKDDNGHSQNAPRAAYEAAHPEPHAWVKDGYLMDSTIGLTKSVPIGNGTVTASVNVGFSAFVKVTQEQPVAGSAGGAVGAAKDMVDLPLTAEQMRNKGVEGYKLTVMGGGTGVIGGSLNVGTTLPAGPVDFGVSAGVSASETKTGQFMVSAESIDGKDQVYVNFAKMKDTAKNLDLNASIGLNTDRLTQSIQDHLPDNGIVHYAENKAFDKLQKGVDMVSVGVDDSHTLDNLKETDEHFRFDLSKPGVQIRQPDGTVKLVTPSDAYNGLMKLDDKAAKELAAIPGSGVVMYDARHFDVSKTSDLNVHAGGKNIYSHTKELDRRGEVDVLQGGKNADKGPLVERDARDVTFKDTRDVLGHQRSVQWEGWTTKDKGGQRQTNFSLTIDRKDGNANPQDIRNFQALGEATGAQVTSSDTPTQKAGGLSKMLHGAYGSATEHVKVTWTQEGVKKWRDATPDQVAVAFGEEARRMSESGSTPGFATADPGKRALACSIMDGYQKLGDMQPNDMVQVDGQRMPVLQARMQLSDRYQKLTQSTISKDAKLYPQFQQIMNAHQTMKGQDERKWGEALGKLGSEQQGNPWLFLATMSNVAGKQNSALEDSSLVGKAAKDGKPALNLSMTDPSFDDKMAGVKTPDQIASQQARQAALGLGAGAVDTLDSNDANHHPGDDPMGTPAAPPGGS
jgi:hypothetical protein